MRPTVLEGVLYLYCAYIAQISFLESLPWAAGRHYTSAPYVCVAHSLRAYSLLGWFLGKCFLLFVGVACWLDLLRLCVILVQQFCGSIEALCLHGLCKRVWQPPTMLCLRE